MPRQKEHAIRKEISIKFNSDPALYESFLEKLKEILKRHSEDPEKEAPFYDLLINKIFKDVNIVDNEDILKRIIVEVVKLTIIEINRTDFWNSDGEIARLKGAIGTILIGSNIDELEEKEELRSVEFVKLAKVRNHTLIDDIK